MPPVDLLQRHSWDSYVSDTSRVLDRLSDPLNHHGLRLSMPSTGDSPLSRTNVRVVGVARNQDHCVFMIHVDISDEQFVITKRFSAFRSFRQQLYSLLDEKKHCASGPCKQLAQQLLQVKFPKRKLRLAKRPDLELARERSACLQLFLQTLLRLYQTASRRQVRSCVNTKCCMAHLIMHFLKIKPPLPPAALASPVGDNSLKSHFVRDLPPATRVSLQCDGMHPLERLYPITEDTELHII